MTLRTTASGTHTARDIVVHLETMQAFAEDVDRALEALRPTFDSLGRQQTEATSFGRDFTEATTVYSTLTRTYRHLGQMSVTLRDHIAALALSIRMSADRTAAADRHNQDELALLYRRLHETSTPGSAQPTTAVPPPRSSSGTVAIN